MNTFEAFSADTLARPRFVADQEYALRHSVIRRSGPFLPSLKPVRVTAPPAGHRRKLTLALDRLNRLPL